MNAAVGIATASFLIIYLAIIGIAILFSLVVYILNGISCMKLAKKVGIEKGWLAFVPIASYYLFGKFAEKDNEIHHPEGKQRKWSKIALASIIVFFIFYIIFMIACFLIGMLAGFTAEGSGESMAILPAIILILFAFVMMTIVIAMTVIQYIIIYKTMHLMVPEHAWWILLVTILVFPYAYNIALLIFAFSKKFPTYLNSEESITAEEATEIPKEVE